MALVALVSTMLLEGSDPTAILLLPPLVLVFGATVGAAMAGSTMDDMKHLGRWFRMALTPATLPTMDQRIATLVDLAGRARREGLLSLDREIGGIGGPVLRKGLPPAVDGGGPPHPPSGLEAGIPPRAPHDRGAA